MKKKIDLTGILHSTELRCSKETHRISLNKKGQLIFHNHPEGFENEKTLISIGGAPCPCYNFLLQWKKIINNLCRYPTAKYWKQFADFCSKAKRISRERRNNQDAVYFFDWDKQSRDEIRKECLTRNVLFKLLKSSDNPYYKHCDKLCLIFRNFNSSSQGYYVNYRWDREGEPFALRKTVVSKQLLVLVLHGIPTDWYDTVYKKGIAMIDGHLVTSAVPTNKANVYEVSFIKKSGNYTEIYTLAQEGFVKIENGRAVFCEN